MPHRVSLPPPSNLTLQALEETSALLHEAMNLTKAMGGLRSPVPLHETSLTLAALDLSLTFRVHNMIPGMKEVGNDPNKVTYHCLQHAVQALKQAGGPINHPHGGYGGADSILLYLSHALATLVKCLEGLRQVTRAREIFRTRLRFAALILLAAIWKKKRNGRSLALWLLGLSYAARKVHFWTLQRSVDTSHRRLLTLLRLWVIMDCVMVYTENCKDRNVAHHTLIARPFQDDVKAQRWLSRQLLEAVPPPPETAFWYEASPVAAALRRFMNVVYASFGNGVAVSGVSNTAFPPQSPWRWRLLGAPVTAASFLYYGLRPGIASRDACAYMSPAPIELLQRAWTSLHNPITEWVALRLARHQGLVWQKRVIIAGVSCYMLAQSDPSLNACLYRPLLFFVHGGGFVSHLFLADMPVLVSWTRSLGPTAVLLIPEYSLVPHARFPKPTQELLAVYKDVREGDSEGGLGFVPSWVAIAGESAGGNLAGSLCVALAGAVVEGEGRKGGGKDSSRGLRVVGGNEGEQEGRHQPLRSCEAHPHLVSVDVPAHVGSGEGGQGGEQQQQRQQQQQQQQQQTEREEEQKQITRAASFVLGLPGLEGGVVAEGERGARGRERGREGGVASHTSSEAGSSSDTEGDEEEKKEGEGEGSTVATPSWVRMPDALVLFYPVLNFCLTPSPSRSVHMADPILPLGVFTAVADGYMPSLTTDPSRDPLISPYFAHDKLLSRFPPTFIGVGGFDPLLDDTVDFDCRLRHVGVTSTLRLGRDLPHGFFGLFGLDKVATGIMEEAGQFLQREGGKEGGSEGGGGTVVRGGQEGGRGNEGGGEKVFCEVEAAVGGGEKGES